jgi:hypothetical protein
MGRQPTSKSCSIREAPYPRTAPNYILTVELPSRLGVLNSVKFAIYHLLISDSGCRRTDPQPSRVNFAIEPFLITDTLDVLHAETPVPSLLHRLQ